jgi:hypothetical protein
MIAAQHAAGEAHGHKSVRYLLLLLIAYALLPAFGIGLYRNSSGDRFFSFWYLLVFLVISFFLIHEFITPMPPKEGERQES